MTQQQVIALIQQWIVANGNEEITADVLRPILEAMVNQPNDLIGDINDLTTTNKDSVVDAINEVNNLSNGGVTIHYGSDTPFITPPVSFELGDYYAQLDGSSVLGFWQYNGNEWVEIKEDTLEGYYETGTREDGNLEVVIGDYDNSSGGTKITINDDDGVIFLEGFTEIRGYDGELRLTRRQDNKYIDLKASNVTDNRAFQFPDKSGTLALIEDIQSFKDYPNTAAMIADQGNQVDQLIYQVEDASGDTNITFPSGETKLQSFYRYNGVANADIDDYTLISVPYGNKKPALKGVFTGEIDLSNIEGTYYNDYNLSSGSLTFSIASSPNIFGWAYLRVIGDGVTELATEGNISAVFEVQNDLPSNLILSTETHIFIFFRMPTGNGIKYIGTAIYDSIPVVTDVSFTGTEEVDSTLSGSYTYADVDGDAESGTTFQWYRADDVIGTGEAAISGATSQNYTLQVADEGKYIRFGVTPSNAIATGVEVFSTYSGEIQAATSNAILFEDDFTGTDIDPLKWNVTNPNPSVISISQNNKLKLSANNTSLKNIYENKIVSVTGFDLSEDLFITFTLNGNLTNIESTKLFGIGDGTHDNSVVINRVELDHNKVALIIRIGGSNILVSEYNYIYSGSYKIKITAGGLVSVYKWNVSYWDSIIVDQVTTLTSGTWYLQGTITSKPEFSPENYVEVDNVFVTSLDFSTLFP